MTSKYSVKAAAYAIRAYQEETGVESEDVITDILCDLMHYCAKNKIDFKNHFSIAERHYAMEATKWRALAYQGVYWLKDLGLFDTEAEALEALMEYEQVYCGPMDSEDYAESKEAYWFDSRIERVVVK